jgi:hypothetical protein
MASEAIHPLQIIRDSVRISLRTPGLWAIALLLLLVMVPAFVLSGGFGVVTFYMMMSGKGGPTIGFRAPAPDLSAGGWALYIVLTLILLTASSLLTYAVQAAMIRAASAAADGTPVSILAALRLGGQRWASLIKLGLTFGLVIQGLGILPALIALSMQQNAVWGAGLMQAAQSFLAPVNFILGVMVFLLMMSIALEDVRPKTAFRRMREVVRSGWWGFLIAYVLQAVLALAIAFIFAVVIAIVAFMLLLAWASRSYTEAVIAGAICLLSTPVGLALLTFILVFSTVFFTLTYRAAAAAAGAAHPPA